MTYPDVHAPITSIDQANLVYHLRPPQGIELPRETARGIIHHLSQSSKGSDIIDAAWTAIDLAESKQTPPDEKLELLDEADHLFNRISHSYTPRRWLRARMAQLFLPAWRMAASEDGLTNYDPHTIFEDTLELNDEVLHLDMPWKKPEIVLSELGILSLFANVGLNYSDQSAGKAMPLMWPASSWQEWPFDLKGDMWESFSYNLRYGKFPTGTGRVRIFRFLHPPNEEKLSDKESLRKLEAIVKPGTKVVIGDAHLGMPEAGDPFVLNRVIADRDVNPGALTRVTQRVFRQLKLAVPKMPPLSENSTEEAPALDA